MAAAQSNVSYQGVDGAVKQVLHKLPDKLGPKEVLLKITHTGVCGSDLHAITFKSVLGHEGVGIVQAIGLDVTQFKVGDRAGAGFLRESCGHCKYCLSGQEIWCYERTIFLESESSRSKGTFADYYVGIETTCTRYPKPSRASMLHHCNAPAPLYSAIIDNVKPGQRVGIIGIGGLGHLAIQFASKLGSEVVVFSSPPAKEKEAREFGASEFYLIAEPEEITKPVDVLILAGTVYPDWGKYAFLLSAASPV